LIELLSLCDVLRGQVSTIIFECRSTKANDHVENMAKFVEQVDTSETSVHKSASFCHPERITPKPLMFQVSVSSGDYSR
jgi:hypothetical protein